MTHVKGTLIRPLKSETARTQTMEAISGDDKIDRYDSKPARHVKVDTLEACVRNRHSCRVFTPDPVSTDLLRQSLELAQLAASNSNIQNWRLKIASGSARDRIVQLLQIASKETDPIPLKLPSEFTQYRNDLVNEIYGVRGYDVMGEERREERQEKRMLQYEFFQAPVCAVISMNNALQPVDAMSVGLFIQTFMLALTERGIGSCLQVSVTGYPEALRRGFELDDHQHILCGMAIGWPHHESPVNRLTIQRDPIESQVTFLE